MLTPKSPGAKSFESSTVKAKYWKIKGGRVCSKLTYLGGKKEREPTIDLGNVFDLNLLKKATVKGRSGNIRKTGGGYIWEIKITLDSQHGAASLSLPTHLTDSTEWYNNKGERVSINDGHPPEYGNLEITFTKDKNQFFIEKIQSLKDHQPNHL